MVTTTISALLPLTQGNNKIDMINDTVISVSHYQEPESIDQCRKAGAMLQQREVIACIYFTYVENRTQEGTITDGIFKYKQYALI